MHSSATDRICCWAVVLCILYLLALVRYEAEQQMISVTSEKALHASFILATAHWIWLVYFEYLRVDFKQDCINELEVLPYLHSCFFGGISVSAAEG